MTMHLLMFVFLLSAISGVTPQKAIHSTEMSARLHSLETLVANISRELITERAARQGLEQELNMTKASWSISYNDALQQIQLMKNTVSDMNNVTKTIFQQMSASLLDTRGLLSTLNKTQTANFQELIDEYLRKNITAISHDLRKELGQTETYWNTTYMDALQRMNSLVQNTEKTLQRNITASIVDLRNELDQTATSWNTTYSDVIRTVNSMINNTEDKFRRNITAISIDLHKELGQMESAWNNTYSDVLQKMKSMIHNTEVKLQTNMSKVYTETSKMLQQQSISMTEVKDAIHALNLTMSGRYSFHL